MTGKLPEKLGSSQYCWYMTCFGEKRFFHEWGRCIGRGKVDTHGRKSVGIYLKILQSELKVKDFFLRQIPLIVETLYVSQQRARKNFGQYRSTRCHQYRIFDEEEYLQV
jgi:hypothetical protein